MDELYEDSMGDSARNDKNAYVSVRVLLEKHIIHINVYEFTRLAYNGHLQSEMRNCAEGEGFSPRSGAHFSTPCQSISGGESVCD